MRNSPTRNPPVLAALFPKMRARILAATFLQADKTWYLTELANFLNAQPSSLQREVDTLGKAGILKLWRDGRRLYLKPDTSSPVFSDLKRLFEKTAGLIPILQQELQRVDKRIQMAFLYGSTALSQERSESDVDLMIVGAVGLSDLVPGLRRAERILGRPVNPTVFSVAEFARKIRSRDHFVTTVLRGAKLFLKGSERELEAMVE